MSADHSASQRPGQQTSPRLEALTLEDLRRVCGAAEGHSPRMDALVHLLATTGMRIQEALDLTPNRFITTEDQTLIHVVGKAGKPRTAVATESLMAKLNAIWPERDDAPIFRTRTGKPWLAGEVRDALRRLGTPLGLSHLHPHMFRYTAATQAMLAGHSLEDVMCFLGHSSASGTQPYLRAVTRDGTSPAPSEVLAEVLAGDR